MSDIWIEDGLPLLSVDVSAACEGLDIEIMLDQGPDSAAHMGHRVRDARSLRILLTATDRSDVLEIENAKGETAVLCFEDRLAASG